MTKLSVYGGTGFVGGNFSRMYPDETIVIPREQREPESDEILYFISTVDNYNVHTNITLDVETNLKVLCETLDKCRDSDVTFNFISSWFVYGDIPLPAREDSHCKPTGFYSITKRAAEDLVMSFCRTYGKNYRILRLANVMGAGDGKTSAKKNALAFMVDKMKKDEEIFLYDDGTGVEGSGDSQKGDGSFTRTISMTENATTGTYHWTFEAQDLSNAYSEMVKKVLVVQ